MYNSCITQLLECARRERNRNIFFRFYLFAIFVVEGDVDRFYDLGVINQLFNCILNLACLYRNDFNCCSFRQCSFWCINVDFNVASCLGELRSRIFDILFVCIFLFASRRLVFFCRLCCLGRLSRFCCLCIFCRLRCLLCVCGLGIASGCLFCLHGLVRIVQSISNQRLWCETVLYKYRERHEQRQTKFQFLVHLSSSLPLPRVLRDSSNSKN